MTDYKSGKEPGKRQPILKGGAELQRCLYAYAVRSLVPAVKAVEARLLFPRAGGDGLYVLAEPTAVLANLAGFVIAAHRYLAAGNLLPGAGAQDDYNDLAFALPSGSKENYFEVKAHLPSFDTATLVASSMAATEDLANTQDQATWEAEAATIAATNRSILWRSPSRHDGRLGNESAPLDENVFVLNSALSEVIPKEVNREDAPNVIKGGRERGLVMHKLFEEVLTGEIREDADALECRARILLSDLGVPEAQRSDEGPCSPEIAASVRRGLQVPEVAALRPRLLAEVTVFAADATERGITFWGGVADALAFDENGKVDIVVDWKSDIEPSASIVDLYCEQVRDYLALTGANRGILVFVTTGRLEFVLRTN